MDLHSDQAYWPIAAGLLASYPPVTEDLEVDVLVVGAGVSGAFLAFELTRAGHTVAVVDRRDVGLGSTSASTALLQAEIDTSLVELSELVGQPRAEAVYRFCSEALARLLPALAQLPGDVSLRRRATLYLASSRRDARGFPAEVEARQRAGVEVELVAASELLRRSALRAPSALVTPHGAHVDPYRLTHVLLAQAAAGGARVFDRTSVTSVDRRAPTLRARTDRGVKIQARRIAWARGYETEAGTSPAVDVDLVSSYAMVSEPLAAVPTALANYLIWESARPYFYLRDTADGRAVIGGEDRAFRNPRRRDRRLSSAGRNLERRFNALFPGTAFEPAYTWAGTFAQTTDGLPRLGFSADQREFFALGYGGNGLLFAFIAAEAAVEAWDLVGVASNAPVAKALELFPLAPARV